MRKIHGKESNLVCSFLARQQNDHIWPRYGGRGQPSDRSFWWLTFSSGLCLFTVISLILWDVQCLLKLTRKCFISFTTEWVFDYTKFRVENRLTHAHGEGQPPTHFQSFFFQDREHLYWVILSPGRSLESIWLKTRMDLKINRTKQKTTQQNTHNIP